MDFLSSSKLPTLKSNISKLTLKVLKIAITFYKVQSGVGKERLVIGLMEFIFTSVTINDS